MTTNLRTALLAAVLAFPASIAAGEIISGPDAARIVIIDGDTIALPSRERVRLIDIDAPESYRSRCERELRLGLAAKARLADLLRAGPVEIVRHGRDRYRRTLALVQVDGQSVGLALVAEGFAQPWKAGRKAKAARLAIWCGGASW